MKITLDVDRKLLREATDATGLRRRADVVAAGLTSLVQREAARRLAAMGGCMPDFKLPPRRRFDAVGRMRRR